MRSLGWVLIQYDWFPYLKKKGILNIDTHTEGRHYGDTGRGEPSTSKEKRPCQHLEVFCSPERQLLRLRGLEESNLVDNLFSDFYLLELWGNKFLLRKTTKPMVLCYDGPSKSICWLWYCASVLQDVPEKLVKRHMGFFCIISYNCMLVYDYLKVKNFLFFFKVVLRFKYRSPHG